MDGLYIRTQFAAQAIYIDLPSNGVVTSNESNDHREIDIWAIVESAATVHTFVAKGKTMSPNDQS